MSLTRPNPFLSKWAENGERFDVPNSGADHTKGYADIQTGFPKQTMISVINGGISPWGRDHNGILYKVTEAIQWTQGGGWPVYSVDFSTENGGYSKGAIVQHNSGDNVWVAWICVQDRNIIDPSILDISKSGEQSGWRRYPVIEDADGATLIYNDAGELRVYNPTNSSSKYVSWSKGNDQTGNGTRANPYKTIDKGIRSSPSTGNVYIYIRL